MGQRHISRGLSLVECLVSIVVVSLGLLAVVQCLYAALLTNQRSNRIALASAVAQQEIEDIRSLSVAGYIAQKQSEAASGTVTVTTVNGVTIIAGRPADPLLLKGTQTVTINDYTDNTTPAINNRLKTVTSTVTWLGNNTKTESVRLTTVMAR